MFWCVVLLNILLVVCILTSTAGSSKNGPQLVNGQQLNKQWSHIPVTSAIWTALQLGVTLLRWQLEFRQKQNTLWPSLATKNKTIK